MATAAPATSASSAVEDHSPASPAMSDKTLVAAPRETDIPTPGHGLALFSTELGTRPPRTAPGPPFPPMVVRSDKVNGVVDAARFWRERFPKQASSIFPGCFWIIEDFWDAKDIQMDGAQHYHHVLEFLMADNVHCAQRFVREWSQEHAEHMASTIGLTDLSGIYDPGNPEAIVDKAFIHGETKLWPRQFLWHAAHMMRATMIAMEVERKRGGDASNISQPASADQKLSVPAEPIAVNEATITKTKQPSPGTHPVPISAVPASVAATQPLAVPPNGRAPPYGTAQPVAQFGPSTDLIKGNIPPQHMVSPSMNAPPLHVNKGGRPAHYAPTHVMRPASYGEQIPRGYSGAYSTHHPSGTMSNVHSPHMFAASMATGPPLAQLPAQNLFPPFSPTAYAAQPYHPAMGPPGPGHQGLGPPGMVPSQMMPMPGPNMPPGYMQQGPNDRGPRGMSFGDMTNAPQYHSHLTPDPRTQQPGNRRNSSYANGSGALYDPYNGARPAFNDTNTGRKPSRTAYTNQQDRPRKSSTADRRQRSGSYGYDRPETGLNGHRFNNKPRLIDDPQVLNDNIYGCGHNWIGPENTTVEELFVSDLIDYHHEQDIIMMFEQKAGIKPHKVIINSPNAFKSINGSRRHAFVSFKTASDAKKALTIKDCNPMARDVSVRVSVPRKYFQKADDSFDVRPSQPEAMPDDDQGNPRRFSHGWSSNLPGPQERESKTQYSPQDVRSSQPGNSSCRSSDAGPMSGGSPNSQSSKARKNSPTEKPKFSSKDTIEEEAIETDIVEPDVVAESAGADKGPAQVAVDPSSVPTAKSPPLSVIKVAESEVVEATDAAAEQSDVHGTLASDAQVIAEKPLSPSPISASALKPVQTDSQSKESLKIIATEGPTVKIPSVSTITAPQASQVKALFGDTEPSGTAVSMPSAPNDVTPPTSQAATENLKAENDGRAEVQKKEKSSDDETEADGSFISAQEDATATETTSSLVAEAMPGGREAQPPLTISGELAGHGSSEVHSSVTTSDHLSPTSLATNVTKALETDASESTAATETTGEKDNRRDAKDVAEPAGDVVSSAKDSGAASTVPSESTTDGVKRQGPQQTTSLNPFAKKTKAQRDKEKALLKKEKKRKEQEEKAAKAKSAKSASSTASQVPVVATDAGQAPPSSTATSSELKTSVNSGSDSANSAANTPQSPEETQSKGKGKKKASVASYSLTATIEGDEAVTGKQTGGTTTTISDEAGSVTEKAEGEQKTTKPPVTEDPPATPPLAPSHDRPDSRLASQGNVSEPALKAGADVVANKEKTPPTALATLNDTPFSAKFDSNSTGMFPSRRGSNAASAASSITLNASDAALASPSPSAENFYTPLQTPAGPSAAFEDLVAKPKKKKSNKKKKKAAAAEETPEVPSTSSVDEYRNCNLHEEQDGDGGLSYDPDPFGEQMSHIDVIRKSVNDPGTYYNMVNREMAEEAEQAKETEEKSAAVAGVDVNTWRQLQGFVKENRNQFAKMNHGN